MEMDREKYRAFTVLWQHPTLGMCVRENATSQGHDLCFLYIQLKITEKVNDDLVLAEYASGCGDEQVILMGLAPLYEKRYLWLVREDNEWFVGNWMFDVPYVDLARHYLETNDPRYDEMVARVLGNKTESS